ncbi:MAG: DUF998 domain-containing protein [Actinomycetota bacterium]|nr:DUF998 domain-containing protein [Actinomycetota bacterium]
MSARRLALACGIAGPAAFVGAWLVGGLQTPGYDPVRQTISQLAREQAATAPLMTGGFVAFGVLVPVYATALRRALGPAPAAATLTSGVATLAVAALPLSLAGGQAVDQGHHVAAGLGYAGQALAPLLAAGAFRGRARTASYVTGGTAAAALVASVLLPDLAGLLQRTGLTVVDVWFAAVAVHLLRRG